MVQTLLHVFLANSVHDSKHLAAHCMLNLVHFGTKGLIQTRSVCSSQATHCQQHNIMLATETFEMRKHLLTLSLVEQK